MDNYLITLHSDGSIMCAENRHGLLCFKTDTETLEQWTLRCSQQLSTGSSLSEAAEVRR